MAARKYIAVGARRAPGQVRIQTKKALREALAMDPQSVVFDPTSLHNDQGLIRGNNIPASVILAVTGPDPYSDRRWHASVGIVRGQARVIS